MFNPSLVQAVKKQAIDFQRASASASEQARMFIDSRDYYVPRVKAAQNNAATYAFEARRRLRQLVELGE